MTDERCPIWQLPNRSSVRPRNFLRVAAGEQPRYNANSENDRQDSGDSSERRSCKEVRENMRYQAGWIGDDRTEWFSSVEIIGVHVEGSLYNN